MDEIATANAAIAKEWRNLVVAPGGWRKAPNQAGGLGGIARGEAGGFFVNLDCVKNRRAYLKPLKRHGWFRAAREKIAFDLAHDLGVNVPPVLLAANERSDSRERHVCLSLVLYPHQFSWGQLRPYLAEATDEVAAAVVKQIPAAASAALAFDTWLGQTDHNDHDSNIVFGYEGARYADGRFLFLDYAFSMGISGSWADNGFERCAAAPFPPRMLELLDKAALASAVGAIEAVSDTTLVEVVERIPEPYLPSMEKSLVRDGLGARRSLVRRALKDYL